jgi:hypothetical protein
LLTVARRVCVFVKITIIVLTPFSPSNNASHDHTSLHERLTRVLAALDKEGASVSEEDYYNWLVHARIFFCALEIHTGIT